MIFRIHARRMIVPGIVAATLSGLLLPLTTAWAETRTFEKRFPAVSGGTLVVRSDFGAVRVSGGANGEVTVVATVEGARADVEEFEFNASEQDGRIEVTGRSGKRGWSFWRSSELEVTYTIRVPDRFRLELNTAGDDVTVRSVDGEVQARTSGGNIGLRDVGGPSQADTSGGDIEIDRAAGSVRARTSGGDITLTAVAGDAEARTSGGDIRATGVRGEVVTRTSGGSIDIGIVGNYKGVTAETSGGSIAVSVDPGIGADVDAKTSGGSVRVHAPGTSGIEAREHHFRGQINGGGPGIRARTSGGSIRISTAD